MFLKLFLTISASFTISSLSFAQADHHRGPRQGLCSRILFGPERLQSPDPRFVPDAQDNRDSHYPVINMNDIFADEDIGKAVGLPITDSSMLGYKVQYLTTPDERLAFEIFVRDSHFVDSQGRKICPGPRKCQGILVMDETGRLFFSTLARTGKFHHSSFLAGGPVTFAGDATFSNGRLRRISNHSGHYTPHIDTVAYLLAELAKQGVNDLERIILERRFSDGIDSGLLRVDIRPFLPKT